MPSHTRHKGLPRSDDEDVEDTRPGCTITFDCHSHAEREEGLMSD